MNRNVTPPLRASASAACPFWLGGFEGADHINEQCVPLDMVRSTGHLASIEDDHARARDMGLGGVRESIGWRLTESSTGEFDLDRAVRVARSAREHGLQVLWTLMHYGTPADVSLLDDSMIERFARFAAEVARVLAPLQDEPPIYNLINEIGFVAWGVSETNQFHPYRGDANGQGQRTDGSGYAVKRRLVRATLAGMQAVRAVDPRARFLHVEPVVHVVAPPDRPELAGLAEQVGDYQWQVWDLIAGKMEPELGGSPAALDLVGVNHYHNGQWEASTERRLGWYERDARRRPFTQLLDAVWTRYGRPIVIAETSHFGAGRADWLHEVCADVREALLAGVQVDGMCLYPLVDRHDWDNLQHWHHSGLWDAGEPEARVEADVNLAGDAPAAVPAHALQRRLCTTYAAALAAWQQHLPLLPAPSLQGTAMSTLIVFSHLRWNFVWQRPQHLMSRLSKHHRVLFVEEPLHADGPPRLDCIPKSPVIDVLVPYTGSRAPGFHDEQLALVEPMVAAYLRRAGIDDYVVWLQTPMALPLIASLHPRAIVYDCMDELSAFKDAPRQLRQRESATMKCADLVLTGGPSLYEARRDAHPNLHCLPSAVDSAHYAQVAPPGDPEARIADALQASIGFPRLGFFGVIDERFDVALLTELAERHADWQFVMVGPVVKIDPERLPKMANIHYLGMQPYERLPRLMAGWQVCLMPFALNEATRFISPTKTLEYMAGGKPVVSSAVHDVESLYGEVICIARSTDEWSAAITRLLAESPEVHAQRVLAMRAMVDRCSWDAAAARVQGLIEEVLLAGEKPAVSQRRVAHAG